MQDDAATTSRLVWVAVGCISLLVLAGQALSVAAGSGADPFPVAMLSFPVVGALIASRQPRNAIGWIMLAVGLTWALDTVFITYAEYGLTIHPGSLPRPDLALALSAPDWVLFIGLQGTFLILLFPDGRLPSPRWGPWAWLCALAMILSFVSILIGPGFFPEAGYPNIRNPLGIDALKPALGAVFGVIALIPISIVAARWA
jgi:hypothetical protein